jgi:hypothetical protein
LARKSLAIAPESIAALTARSPERYARIVELLEAGHSPGGVAALMNVNIATVRAVRELVGGAIHTAIRKLGYDLTEAAQRAAERLVNEIDRVPIDKLPQALAILLDKSLLIAGAPTQRVAVERAKVLSPEQLREMFDRLEKGREKPAKVVDSAEPRTFGGGNGAGAKS